MAHLEGAYEQIDKRLGGVEAGLGQLRSEVSQIRSEMHSGMDQIRSEIHTVAGQLRTELTGRMDSQLRWLLGTILTTWVTIILAIFFRP